MILSDDYDLIVSRIETLRNKISTQPCGELTFWGDLIMSLAVKVNLVSYYSPSHGQNMGNLARELLHTTDKERFLKLLDSVEQAVKMDSDEGLEDVC